MYDLIINLKCVTTTTNADRIMMVLIGFDAQQFDGLYVLIVNLNDRRAGVAVGHPLHNACNFPLRVAHLSFFAYSTKINWNDNQYCSQTCGKNVS